MDGSQELAVRFDTSSHKTNIMEYSLTEEAKGLAF